MHVVGDEDGGRFRSDLLERRTNGLEHLFLETVRVERREFVVSGRDPEHDRKERQGGIVSAPPMPECFPPCGGDPDPGDAEVMLQRRSERAGVARAPG